MAYKANAAGDEKRLIDKLVKLMREHKYSLRKLGGELGISKSAAQNLTALCHYPLRRDRGEINGKLRRLVRDFERRENDVGEEKSFEGGDIMEQLTHETLEKFGLKRDPFLNEITSARDIFELPETLRAYKFMERAAKYQGFGGVIGEVGSGKTLLLRKLTEELRDHVRFVQPRLTNKSKLRYNHILDAIYYDLTGKRSGFGGISAEMKSRIVFGLLELAMESNERVCLVIDDAQQLPMETLKNLKQLYDPVGFQRQLGILLLGQLELIKIMKDLRIREVTQRCAHFFMQGLARPGLLENYLVFKIKKAGGDAGRIFEKNVFGLMRKNATMVWDGNDGRHGRGGKIKITPQLRVQNVAAMLMNKATELEEKMVSKEIFEAVLGK